MKLFMLLFGFYFVLSISTASAGEADVVSAQIQKQTNTTYSFDVTITHKDTGWDHYANKWDIIDEKGNILGTRTLHHPHVNEQPFTRSLSNVNIPSHVKTVTIRAHDSIHQYGGKELKIKLPN